MSGGTRAGDAGWLDYDGKRPEPAEVDPSAQDQRTETTASAWLRYDLPDDAGAPDSAVQVRDAAWLAPDLAVTPQQPAAEEAHDTGVPPTIAESAAVQPVASPVSAPAWAPQGYSSGRPVQPHVPPGSPTGEAATGAADAAYPVNGEPPREVTRVVPADEVPVQAAGEVPVRPAAPDRTQVVAAVTAGDEPDQPTGPRKGRHDGDDEEPVSALAVLGAAVKEFAIVVGMALILSFIVKTWLLQAFYIPSGSMEDTLVLNDRVIVSKLTPGPVDLKRGDIIVFADPGQWLEEVAPVKRGQVATIVTETMTFVGLLPDNSENHLIKRVIGLPGDHVECCDEGGRITVNGAAIKEPYLKPGDAASEQDFTITVPNGRVWVMGDHRSNSADSRSHDGPENDGTQGSVDERLIVGRAVALVWPLDHLTWLSNPTATFAHVPAPSPDTVDAPSGAPAGDSGADGTDGGSDGEGGGEAGGTDAPAGAG